MNDAHTKPSLHGKLALDTAMGNFLGDTRIKLLEAIDKHGSISQAAKAVPLSYKAAWDAVDAMNNLAPEPLVLRTTGGKHGGGTELTAYGRRLIAFYRALEQEYQAAIDRLAGRLDSADQNPESDIAGFRQLLRRMSMKSSARNQFAGPIEEIKQGAVDCEVRIRLDDSLDLTAIITRESAENLGLAVGKDVQAFVKSSSILLVMDEATRISARNRFCGEVTRIHEGPVNAEVTVALPGGRHVITAVITHESLKNLDIVAGRRVCAVFKASSVFLAVAA